jgi:hypothetical protein
LNRPWTHGVAQKLQEAHCLERKWEEIFCRNEKNKWRGTRILHGDDMTFSKKLTRVSDGFGILVWRVISSAHNLILPFFLKMPNIIFSVMQKTFLKCVIRQRVGRFLHSRKLKNQMEKLNK